MNMRLKNPIRIDRLDRMSRVELRMLLDRIEEELSARAEKKSSTAMQGEVRLVPVATTRLRYVHPASSKLAWDGVGQEPDWVASYLAYGGTRVALENAAEMLLKTYPWNSTPKEEVEPLAVLREGYRKVTLKGCGKTFVVAKFVVRVDIDEPGRVGTHGWQVRYSKPSKFFNDSRSGDSRNPERSLEEAHAYLRSISGS